MEPDFYSPDDFDERSDQAAGGNNYYFNWPGLAHYEGWSATVRFYPNQIIAPLYRFRYPAIVRGTINDEEVLIPSSKTINMPYQVFDYSHWQDILNGLKEHERAEWQPDLSRLDEGLQKIVAVYRDVFNWNLSRVWTRSKTLILGAGDESKQINRLKMETGIDAFGFDSRFYASHASVDGEPKAVGIKSISYNPRTQIHFRGEANLDFRLGIVQYFAWDYVRSSTGEYERVATSRGQLLYPWWLTSFLVTGQPSKGTHYGSNYAVYKFDPQIPKALQGKLPAIMKCHERKSDHGLVPPVIVHPGDAEVLFEYMRTVWQQHALPPSERQALEMPDFRPYPDESGNVVFISRSSEEPVKASLNIFADDECRQVFHSGVLMDAVEYHKTHRHRMNMWKPAHEAELFGGFQVDGKFVDEALLVRHYAGTRDGRHYVQGRVEQKEITHRPGVFGQWPVAYNRLRSHTDFSPLYDPDLQEVMRQACQSHGIPIYSGDATPRNPYAIFEKATTAPVVPQPPAPPAPVVPQPPAPPAPVAPQPPAPPAPVAPQPDNEWSPEFLSPPISKLPDFDN